MSPAGGSHEPPLLVVNELTKAFPGLIACDGVSLSVRRGEVMAVLGENGAGKSTLVKMLYGLTRPDSGRIEFAGNRVEIDSPRVAAGLGIGMVSQEFMLVDALTVTENVLLSERRSAGGRAIDLEAENEAVRDVCERYGMPLDPTALVGDLPIGLKQRVEIVKALIHGAQLLILDEPTAVLTPGESASLLTNLKTFRDEGMAIMFISHKLGEVVEVADRVTVLRRGRVVASIEGKTTPEALGREMIGEAFPSDLAPDEAEPGPVTLSVRNVAVQTGAAGDLRGASLQVRAGEILGVAGVEGNGQDALAHAISGLMHPDEGRIEVLGKDISGLNPRQIAELGVSYVPADRLGLGLVTDFSVAENLILKSFRSEPASRRRIINRRHVRRMSNELIETYDVRVGGPDDIAAGLSGGNLQKVVLARELGNANPRLVVAMHPTRGLDVRAARSVHKVLLDQRKAQVAVLLISADLDEVTALSDRIVVLSDGKILDERPRATFSYDWLAPLMGGHIRE